jgi:hypothetical protein
LTPFLLAAVVGNTWAGPVTITGSGTWSSTATTAGLSAPNESWTLSFEVSSPIPLTNVNTTGGQSVAVLDAVYKLNGVVVGTINDARFFSSGFSGLFSLDFSGVGSPNDLDFYGPQVFDSTSGAILTNTYSGVSDVGVTHDPAGEGTASFTIAPTATVPEPSTLINCVTALGFLGFVRWNRRRHG